MSQQDDEKKRIVINIEDYMFDEEFEEGKLKSCD
jgi:hypothetical protein